MSLLPPRLVIGTAVCGSLLLPPSGLLEAKEPAGKTATVRIESPHPYPDGDATLPVVWRHTLSHPGATFLKVRFARLDLGAGDHLEILDGRGRVAARYTEQDSARRSFWALAVEGDTVTMELRADAADSAEGVVLDRYGHGTARLRPESVCGLDRREDVACYAGTPLETASRAVGRMLFEDGGLWFSCTGSLVSGRDHLLTAEHCISSQAAVDSLEVRFDHQATSCGGSSIATASPFAGDRLVLADPSLDVALVTLKGSPSAAYGFLPLSAREPALGESLYLPQYPWGGPKKVSVTGCLVSTPKVDGRSPGSDFGHQCDTEPGSSGAPVLDLDHRVVGVHRAGGCTGTGGENRAVLMSRTLPVLPLPDGGLELTVAKFSRDRMTLRGVLTLAVQSEGIAPLTEPVTVVLANENGEFYSATVPAGGFRQVGRTAFVFSDATGTAAHGLTAVRLTLEAADLVGVLVKGRHGDLRGADGGAVIVTVRIGDDSGTRTLDRGRRPGSP